MALVATPARQGLFMYTVLDNFDRTNNVPFDTIKFSQFLGDSASKLDFSIDDVGSLITASSFMEVSLWDETTSAGVPAVNLESDPTLISSGGHILAGTLSGILSFVSNTVRMTFSNNIVGNGFVQDQIDYGYVHPGQKYMFSIYVQATTLVNAQAEIKIDWLDGYGNILAGGLTSTFTPTTRTRHNLSGTAPAGTQAAYIYYGGLTSSTTNSGTITYDTVQMEPMWFATTQGVSYPTADCNPSVVTCYTMPDATTSRACRLYSGYVNDVQRVYDGPNRTINVSCAGPDAILDAGGQNGDASSINLTFSNSYDDQIISTIQSTYFPGLLSIGAPNTSLPASVVRGAFFTNVSYSDNSFRDILNALIDQSGFSYYVDPYYRINYTPLFYNEAAFALTDATPDNVTTFNYHDYTYEEDATQIKWQVKVLGGNFIAPAISDTFSGNGSNKVFTLSQQPLDVKYVTVGGANQKAGISGVNTFVQGYAVLIDKANLQMTFNTAPPNAANNTIINYTYQSPVSVNVLNQETDNMPPAFVQKVNDSSITDLTTATLRGIGELVKYSKPRILPQFAANEYIQPGYAVFFTSTADGIVNEPYIVYQVDGACLGNGKNEYTYTVGAYNPTVVDHLRQHNKNLNKSTTTANVYSALQTDLVFVEKVQYSEAAITFTAITSSPNVYGTGVWGVATWS
jgi:hypothetical protein